VSTTTSAQPAQLTRNERLDRLPFNKAHRKLLVASGIGWAFDAMDVGLVSFVVAAIAADPHFNLTPTEKSWVLSIGFVGMAIGAAVGGFIADRVGRKTVFTATLIIFGIANGAMALSWSLGMLLGARLIIGLGLGAELPVASTLVSEFSPTKQRGRMTVLLESFWAVGWIVAAMIGYFVIPNTGDWGWRWALAIGALPLLYAIVTRVHIPESVRFLEAKGREDEAEKAVRYFLGPDVEIGEIRNRPNKTQMPKVAWSDLFKPGQVKKLIFSGIPWACEGLGVYGIGVFLPVLVMALGLETGTESAFSRITDSVLLTTWINLCILPGFVLGLLLVNRWYHVRTQTWGFILCAAGMGILLAAYEFHWPVWIAVSGFMLFELFLNAGPHLMTFIIPPQIYSVAERGAGAGLAAAFGKLGAVAGVVVIPILLKWGGASLVLWVTIGVLLAGALVTAVVGREVLPDKGRSVRPEIRRD